jgi:hypothetical protein
MTSVPVVAAWAATVKVTVTTRGEFVTPDALDVIGTEAE